MNKNFKNLREEIALANERLRKVQVISKEAQAEEILRKGLQKIKNMEEDLNASAEQGVCTEINPDTFIIPVSIAEARSFVGEDEKYLNDLGMKLAEDGESIILM